MDLQEAVRELVRQEMKGGVKLNLRQVSAKAGIKYKRLWHFMSTTQPGRLRVEEVQQAYENLTGKPLLTNDQ